MKKLLSIITLLVLVLFTSACVGRSGPSGISPEIINSITVTSESKLEFYDGEFDPTLIKIHLKRANETEETITLTSEMIKTNLSELTVGVNNIKCEYLKDTSGNPFVFYVQITILPKNDTRFTYQSDQLKTCYYIDGYVGTDSVVTLPTTYNNLPVIGILDSAFLKNNTLKIVNIPSGYTSIESAAFYLCENLSSVSVPKTVKTIGDYALSGVRTIFLEGKINTNWSNKWYDDKAGYVYEETILNNLVYENNYQYLVSEENVILTNYIGEETTLSLPNTYQNIPVDTLGAYAFGFNKVIESVVIGSNTKVIMNNAFNNCEALTTISLPVGLETIEASAFCYCSSLNNFELPSTLKFIGYGAFNMCTTLTVLVIPESVETIDGYAFAWCTGLKELYIHDTLINFGQGAIYSCSKLRVYTEYQETPTTWHKEFNPSNRPIVWGYEIAK